MYTYKKLQLPTRIENFVSSSEIPQRNSYPRNKESIDNSPGSSTF